jgi:hypothetical protein
MECKGKQQLIMVVCDCTIDKRVYRRYCATYKRYHNLLSTWSKESRVDCHWFVNNNVGSIKLYIDDSLLHNLNDIFIFQHMTKSSTLWCVFGRCALLELLVIVYRIILTQTNAYLNCVAKSLWISLQTSSTLQPWRNTMASAKSGGAIEYLAEIWQCIQTSTSLCINSH